MADEIIVRAENISKHFKVGRQTLRAVDGVSFQLKKGTTLGIVGESGSGKSTLARVVLDLIPATSGSVEFMGENFFQLSKEKRRLLRREMQIIFQNPFLSLFPHMSVSANIAEPFIVNKKSFGSLGRAELNERISGLMDLVGVPREHAGMYPHELSGGQQQRVGIARALVVHPKIIFADEPTGNLDSKTTMEVLALMRKIVREQDQTLVMVTHDNHLATYADRQFHIVDGKIVKIEEQCHEGAAKEGGHEEDTQPLF